MSRWDRHDVAPQLEAASSDEEEVLSAGSSNDSPPPARPPPPKPAAPLPAAPPVASKMASSSMSKRSEPKSEDYNDDFEDDFEEEDLSAEELSDDGKMPPPSKPPPPAAAAPPPPAAAAGRRAAAPAPAAAPLSTKPPAEQPIDDLLSNFDALLKGYKAKPETPLEPVVAPKRESGGNNAKLDNLLAELEADVAETAKPLSAAPAPKPVAAPPLFGMAAPTSPSKTERSRDAREALFGDDLAKVSPSTGKTEPLFGGGAEADAPAPAPAPAPPMGRGLGRRASAQQKPQTADDVLGDLTTPRGGAVLGAPSWLRDDPPPSKPAVVAGVGGAASSSQLDFSGARPMGGVGCGLGGGASAPSLKPLAATSNAPPEEKPKPKKYDFSAVQPTVPAEPAAAETPKVSAEPAPLRPNRQRDGADKKKRGRVGGGPKKTASPFPEAAQPGAGLMAAAPASEPPPLGAPRGAGGPKASRPKQHAPPAMQPPAAAGVVMGRLATPSDSGSVAGSSAAADVHKLDKLAVQNASLEAQVRQVKRLLQKANAQKATLDAQHGEQQASRPRGEQRKGQPRHGGGAERDAQREAAQLASAQKQLAYYAKEAEMLQRKMARVTSVEHLHVLEATVQAKTAALEEARRKGKELKRAQKENDRKFDVARTEDPSRDLGALGEDVRVTRKHLARLAQDNAKEAQAQQLEQQRCADLEAEVGAVQRDVDAGSGARAAAAQEAARAAREQDERAAVLKAQAQDELAEASHEQAEHRQQLQRTQAQVKMLRSEVEALEGHLKRKEKELRLQQLKLAKKRRQSQAEADDD